MKLRINAKDKSALVIQDKAIADAYRNKFIIPLDFEMLDSSAPYYQAGLGNRLCYEITFNDYNRVRPRSNVLNISLNNTGHLLSAKCSERLTTLLCLVHPC